MGTDVVYNKFSGKMLPGTKVFRKFKVGACYVLYNEEDYIISSLDSIYERADKIYILLGVPFDGLDSTPDSTEELVRNYFDYDKKIKIFKTDAQDESKCKNFLLNECRKDKMEYCWVVDGDEVYNEKFLNLFFRTIDPDTTEAVMDYCREYWRSLHHSPGISTSFILFKVLPDLSIRIRCPSRNVNCLNCPKSLILYNHYGLARKPEKIREKYTITKNRERKDHKFKLDKWMNEKFLAWEKDKTTKDLFPFRSGIWHNTKPIPIEETPDLLRNHKYYGMDCIK